MVNNYRESFWIVIPGSIIWVVDCGILLKKRDAVRDYWFWTADGFGLIFSETVTIYWPSFYYIDYDWGSSFFDVGSKYGASSCYSGCSTC